MHISVFVDDLLISSKTPHIYLNMLKKVCKLKVNANLEHYLGIDIINLSRTKAISVERYISKGVCKIETKVCTLQKEKTPMKRGAHVELDVTPFFLVDSNR